MHTRFEFTLATAQKDTALKKFEYEEVPSLQIAVNPSAPRELQRIGSEYWKHDGEIEDIKGSKWVFPQHQLGYYSWASEARFAAGAGVTATLVGYSCVNCSGPMECSARSTVESTIGGKRAKCRHCVDAFEDRVKQVLDPDLHAERVAAIAQARKESEEREEKYRQAAQLEQCRQGVLKHLGGSQCGRANDEVIGRASVLAKVGGLLWLQRQMGLHVGSSSLEISLMSHAWKSGILTINSHPDTADFQWDRENPSELTGLKSASSLVFNFENSGDSEGERKRVYELLLSELKLDLLTEGGIRAVRWLISEIIVMEAFNALLAVPVDLIWSTSTVKLSAAQRDELIIVLQRTAQHACLRDILIAMQSAVHCAQDQYNDALDEWLEGPNISDNAFLNSLKNLQMLQTGNFRYLHPEVEIETNQLSSLTRLVFLHCLDLNPMDTVTSPQAIEHALISHADTPDNSVSMELSFNSEIAAAVEEYAKINDVSISAVVENALKNFLSL